MRPVWAAPALFAASVAAAGGAAAQPVDPAVLRALAPTGTLRAAINFGNPVLAQRGPDGAPGGVSVALAAALARRLGVPLTVVPYAQAGLVTDALGSGAWDICFLAHDPVRGRGIAFTAPYVLIEGGYAVAAASPVVDMDSVDRPGTGVAVVRGSAYDLFLSRALKQAELVRYGGNDAAAAALLSGAQPVLAGVKQPLAALVQAHPGLRLLPGRFMVIEQAIGTPLARGEAGSAFLQAFAADAKASGLVAQALKASGQEDAQVAP